MKEITNIFRRVYRIYAHAWFQHRDVFWRVESRSGLYIFFKTVCDEYGMIQPENYTIPAEAEGVEPEMTRAEQELPVPPSVMKRDADGASGLLPNDVSALPPPPPPAGNTVMASGDTTKRHRHTMSDRVSSVNTVIQEEAEEDQKPAEASMADIPAPAAAPHGVPEVLPLAPEPPSDLTEELIGTESAGTAEAGAPAAEELASEDDGAEVTVIEIPAESAKDLASGGEEEEAEAVAATHPHDAKLDEAEELPATSSSGTEPAADAAQATKSVAD
nr:hypothetical protein CFP56_11182 [Quercus suber]